MRLLSLPLIVLFAARGAGAQGPPPSEPADRALEQITQAFQAAADVDALVQPPLSSLQDAPDRKAQLEYCELGARRLRQQALAGQIGDGQAFASQLRDEGSCLGLGGLDLNALTQRYRALGGQNNGGGQNQGGGGVVSHGAQISAGGQRAIGLIRNFFENRTEQQIGGVTASVAAGVGGGTRGQVTRTYGRPGPNTLKINAVPGVNLSPTMLTDAEARGTRHERNPLVFAMAGVIDDINRARTNFYLNPNNVDRTTPALDEAEHHVGMYQLEQGFSRFVPSGIPSLPSVMSTGQRKAVVDLGVGLGAIFTYNVVFGVPLGLYQVSTGQEAAGLGMGGHFIVASSRFVQGVSDHYQGRTGDADRNFDAFKAEVASGWADFLGDVKGTWHRLRDDLKNN